MAYSYAVNRSALGFALIAVVAACTPKNNQSTDRDEQQRETLKKLTQLTMPLIPPVPEPEPPLVPEPPLPPADGPVRTGPAVPAKPLPMVALRPFAQLVPPKPGPFGRAAMLRPKLSIAQVTAQLRDVSDDPAAVFARVPAHALCEQDIAARYDFYARMNTDNAGVALMFESDKDLTSLVEFSIVLPTDATELLTQKWGPPAEGGVWFDAAGIWQISTSEMACGDIVFPTVRFAVRPLTRAELLGREIPQWFGRPLTAQLSTVQIERTPTATDTAEATGQMEGSFEFEATDGEVSGEITTNAANNVVAVELTFATSRRADQREMMRQIIRSWGKPTVEVTDDGDIGVVFHFPGFKIYGADTGNESWEFTISR